MKDSPNERRALIIVLLIALITSVFIAFSIEWLTHQNARIEKLCKEHIMMLEPRIEDKLVRIFMHEPNHFTFFQKRNADLSEVETIEVRASKVNIFEDVAPEKQNWISFIDRNNILNHPYAAGHFCDYAPNEGGVLDIHLHRIHEVNGAGWEEFHWRYMEKGTTQVIE